MRKHQNFHGSVVSIIAVHGYYLTEASSKAAVYGCESFESPESSRWSMVEGMYCACMCVCAAVAGVIATDMAPQFLRIVFNTCMRSSATPSPVLLHLQSQPEKYLLRRNEYLQVVGCNYCFCQTNNRSDINYLIRVSHCHFVCIATTNFMSKISPMMCKKRCGARNVR